MTHFLFLIIISYLCGSVPFGLIIGKVIKKIDLRDFGSGNIGATNVGRVLGYRWGLICLALDALKGLIPVATFPKLLFNTDNPLFVHANIASAIATIVGHMFPIWLGFRGGKGVATSLGVLLVISPWGVLVAATLFFGSLLIWRYVSLSSMIAAIGFGSYELFIRLQPSPFSEAQWSAALFAILIPVLILLRHRSNIIRLLQGTEPKLGRDGKPATEAPSSDAKPKSMTE